MWCGRCYRASACLKFKIAKVENELGATWMRDDDNDKYLVGKNGDSLIVPFQYDYCWFVNLKERLPDIDKESDTMLMGYIC